VGNIGWIEVEIRDEYVETTSARMRKTYDFLVLLLKTPIKSINERVDDPVSFEKRTVEVSFWGQRGEEGKG